MSGLSFPFSSAHPLCQHVFACVFISSANSALAHVSVPAVPAAFAIARVFLSALSASGSFPLLAPARGGFCCDDDDATDVGLERAQTASL